MSPQTNCLPSAHCWTNEQAGLSTSQVVRFLVALPRWAFLGILCYAPWAFGCTRPWSIDLLNVLLGGCLALWLLSSLAIRQLPRLPVVLVSSSAFLFLLASWMTLNAKFTYNPVTLEFAARAALLADAPGSIDQARSAEVGMGAALLLGALLFVAQCGRDPVWRRRLLYTMAGAGTALILFGLVQKALSAPAIFWGAAPTGKTFFATYRYHSNAGAFINLIWPLAALGLVLALRKTERLWIRVSWAAALALCLVALVVTGARAAGIIALLFLSAAVLWAVRSSRRGQLPPIPMPVAIVAGILIALVIVAAAATAGLDVSSQRWTKVDELFSLKNPRLLADSVCLKMIPDAGWFGFGPGTFPRAFPYYTSDLGHALSGVWLQAHQDYLQTVIEWGYLGALAWGVVVGGALLRGYRARGRSFTENTTTSFIAVAMLMTLVHALVDFPLQIASLQLYFVTLAGLLWSASSTPRRNRSNPSSL